VEAYLDNSATTRCYEGVRDIVDKTMMTDYGNPSAMHRKGFEAERYVRDSAQIIAKALKVKEKEIFFTSGGTESNNWALLGAAWANRRSGNHIITTAVEHPAAAAPIQYLQEQGFDVTILSVDDHGVLRMEDVETALRKDTILISTIYVNNEIGSVQPVEAIGKLVHQKVPGAIYHVDAIQAFGKYKIYPGKLGIDMMSVSGHKIHGPKGIGFLYICDQIKIAPLIRGGGQQSNMRSGTENVPGIAGLGAAVQQIYQDHEEKTERLYQMKQYFVERLRQMPQVSIHGMEVREGAPHIVSAGFEGIRSEVLLHALEERNIYVSAGSACSTHKRAGSSTLTAMGVPKEQRESAVRFSFSEYTTKEELEYCLQTLREITPVLRKFTRR